MPHPELIQWSPDRYTNQLQDSPFGGRKTTEQYVQLSVDPSQGLTQKRYGWYSDGLVFDNTHFSNVEAGIRLETGASGTDEARIRTAYPGQYLSQALAQPGLGFVVDDSNVTVADGESALTHGELYAGAFYWNDANSEPQTGLGFKWDSEGWTFFIKSLGNHIGPSPVSQSDFGVDTGDGKGHSGRTFSPADGYVYNFPFTWYNQGPLGAAILDPVANHVQEMVRVAIEGRPTMDTANLPVQLAINNAGTAQSLGVELGGMQFSTHGAGREDISRRKTEVARVTPSNYVATTRTLTADEVVDPIATPGDYLMGVRRQSDIATINIRVSNLDIVPDGGDILVMQWDEYDNGNALTGATFEAPTAAVDPDQESQLEVDTAATDYTPSIATFRGMDHFDGGTGSKVSAVGESVDLRIPIDATRILTAVNMGSSATLNPVKATFDESY